MHFIRPRSASASGRRPSGASPAPACAAHFLAAGVIALWCALPLSSARAAASPDSSGRMLAYDIPAGPLDQALNLYALHSRTLLVIDPVLAQGKRSAGLRGSYDKERALELLLAGSGLQAERRADDSVVLRRRDDDMATLPVVSVVAGADPGREDMRRAIAGGALGARAALDTPFSVRVVEREEIQERQVTTVEQAFRLDPSVTAASGEYARGSSILVRGLGIDETDGLKMDGLAMPGWGNDMLPLEMFERVELLKGASGFMYGFGAPGAIMNYVLKRPVDDNVFAVDVGYKTGSLLAQHIDAGGRAGDDKRFGYRVNLVHEQGGTYFTGGELVRDAASLALELKLTSRLTLSFDTLYARRKSLGNAFWGFALGKGLPIPATIEPGTRQQPAGSYFNNENIMVSTGLQWRLEEGWKGRLDYRYAREDVDYVYSTVRIGNAAGDTTVSQSAGIYGFQFQQLQAMLEGQVRTGAVTHQLALGASRQVYQMLDDRDATIATVGAGSLYRDNSLGTGGISNDGHRQYRSTDIVQDALFASDTLALDERWSLIAGARYTRFDQRDYNDDGTAGDTYRQSPLTPTLALMFKPAEGATLYGSYVEALERGGVAGNNGSGGRTANYGEAMGAVRSRQVELGLKAGRERWAATAALFRIRRAAEYVNAANDFVQDGETRYQGLDLWGRYDLTPALSVAGGVMRLDARYLQTSADMAGRAVAGAPRFQATASVRYRVLQFPGLSLNAGGRHVGRSRLNTTSDLDLPSYTVFDGGAQFRTYLAGRDVTLNAQIQNLTDNRYWVYNGSNYMFAGAPRTLSLNVRMEF